MSAKGNISDFLPFCTIRIETKCNDGAIGIGTGFYYDFDDNGLKVPAIITNKHVIEDATIGVLRFHGSIIEDGKHRLSTMQYEVELDDFQSHWIMHPAEEVDLCALPLAELLADFKEADKSIFYIPITKDLIWSDEKLQEFNTIESVIMIGYPIGLWDDVNNLPIIRKGITATHPANAFCGKQEGTADIACYPGSSGSPVFTFNESGTYFDRKGGITTGLRFAFLGVTYAVAIYDAQGVANFRKIPTRSSLNGRFEIPTNLALYIKAQEIEAMAMQILKK